MGSTGWADKHEAELKQKAVVYLNSDSNGKGSALSAGGTPLLEAFFQEVARDVKTPMPRYSAMGAGSDYVAFQHHLGIAAANFGFTQADSGGVYHSAYDSIEWFRRHSDGEFANGRRLAQFMGTSILRLAEAPALPFEVTALERGIRQYVSELEDASGGRLDTVRIRAELAKLTGKGPEVSYLTERLFAADGGLPGRPWYRYLLAAPGLTTGYGAKTLPGVREAVDAGRFRTANRELARIAAMLESVNRELSP